MVGYHNGAFASDIDPVMVVVVPCCRLALEVDLAILLSVAVTFVGKCARGGRKSVVPTRMVGYDDGAFASDVDPIIVVDIPCRRLALEVDLSLLPSVAVAFVGKCTRKEGERVSSP